VAPLVRHRVCQSFPTRRSSDLGLRQGQGEEGVQGRAAADLPRRRLGAARARRGGQAPQGLSLLLGIDLGASNVRTVIARDDDVPSIVGRDERPTPLTGGPDVVSAIADSARAALAAAKAAV